MANFSHLARAREQSKLIKLEHRLRRLELIRSQNHNLLDTFKKPDVAKIGLSILYVTEGSKRNGAMNFGNSDPKIISTFLHLMRVCYKLDEAKFRCTLQCRADQNIRKLQRFWSKLTKIPNSQFCKVQVDKRSVGKVTMKANYKGVCRVTYYSAQIHTELLEIADMLLTGH